MSIDNLNIHQQRRVFKLYQQLNNTPYGEAKRTGFEQASTRRASQIFRIERHQNNCKQSLRSTLIFSVLIPERVK